MSTADRSSVRWKMAVTAASAALLAACSSDEPAAAPEPRATPATSSAAAPSTPAARSTGGGTPDLSAPETVATGIEVPWGLAFLPDGSALVAERDSGDILRVRTGGGKPEQVFTVPGVSAAGEGGLLGLAVAADYAETKWVYAYYTAAEDNRIVRFKLGGGNPEVIFDGIDKAGIHNGGRIAFGPDKMLYAGTGDAGDGTQSQDAGDPNGKILRLTPRGEPAPGNPRAGSPVWSMGHRNVQGLAWDAQGRLYASEFGQNTWDEVNLIVAGGNYGWPTVEGHSTDTRFRDPIVVWSTAEASPSGATIDGDTLYVAALRGQRLWAVPLDGAGGAGTPISLLQGQYGRLRTAERAPDGSLWITTSNRDGRGSPVAADDRVIRFPAIAGRA
jgi:glucose/arabinose dehydrogenase